MIDTEGRAPLLWVGDPADKRGIAGRHLTLGKPARVSVTRGLADGTAIVRMDAGRLGQSRDQLEIPLDHEGNGARDWLVPAWPLVHFRSDDCAEIVRPVDLPLTRRHRLTHELAYRLRSLGRALEFVAGDTATAVGVGRKLGLLRRLARNRRELELHYSVQGHMRLVQTILNLDPALEGDVVECGCWDGASTISLSLACEMTGRRLFVCDSFEGLPAPRQGEAHPTRSDGVNLTHWLEGSFASRGGLEGVEETVRKYGAVDVCHFVKGYFEDTLVDLPTDSIVMVFEDADLPSSVESCVRHLWPKLRPGCKFFSDEPWSFDVVSLFYREAWWQEELGVSAPGFYGSEIGLRDAPTLGCAVKPLNER